MGEMNNVNATYSLVIVVEDPSETFDVMCCDPGNFVSAPLMHHRLAHALFPEFQVGVRNTELLFVIPFTVTGLPESMHKIVRTSERGQGR